MIWMVNLLDLRCSRSSPRLSAQSISMAVDRRSPQGLSMIWPVYLLCTRRWLQWFPNPFWSAPHCSAVNMKSQRGKWCSKLEKQLNASESATDISSEIYAAWNPLMVHLHKLGFMYQDAETRVRTLQTAGMLEPFELVHHAYVPNAR